jgi:succinate dehydrogenase / fumarate reductase cytochrome b subunit
MIKPTEFKLPVSSIVNKLVMSVTGAFLVLFMAFHASMNVVAIISAEGYNAICEFLGANWYALAATAVLAGGVALHFVWACYLTFRNFMARGTKRYAVEKAPKGVSWSSRNMLVLGAVVLMGLLLHLYNFWYNMQLVEVLGEHTNRFGYSPTDGVALIAQTFSCPGYVAIYLLWFTAIWLHLTHGMWSMMQSVGWANKKWYPRLKCIANIFATIICLMFASVAVVFYLRSVCCGAAC